MDLYIRMTVDTNDADLVSSFVKVKSNDKIERLHRVYSIIRNYGCNFPCMDHNFNDAIEYYAGVISPEDIEFMYNEAPNTERGFHTIKNIELIQVAEIRELGT